MVPFFSGPFATLAFEVVAKSIKALNHEGHEEHKEELFFSFVLFVSFVVPFFSGPFTTPAFARMTVSTVTRFLCQPRRQE